MSYTLYIGEDCKDCVGVLEYMDKSGLEYKVVDVTQTDADSPTVFIIPALFLENKVMAYGSDIINYVHRVVTEEVSVGARKANG